MNSVWAVSVLIIGVIASIAGVLCLVVLWRMQRVFAGRQRELEKQVSTLDDAVRMLESCLSVLHPQWSSAEEAQKSASIVEALEAASEEAIGETIEPEIQAALAAAAVAAAGPNARLKSAREIKTREDVSAWTQQGRVLVQASHNLRVRR